MTLGISSYTFGWTVGNTDYPMDAHALLDYANAEAVSVVQICDNLPLIDLPVRGQESVLRHARDAGITVELGTRGLTEENLHAHLELAARFEVRLLRFVIDAPGYHPTLGEATRVLQSALPRLADTGLVIGIENHDRFPARDLRRFIDDLNHPQVGICLDTANSLGAGEGIEHVLTHLAPVTVNLHVKDFHIERVPYLMGFTVSGRQAGQGMLNLPALKQAVEEGGRCTSAILELWTPPEATMAATIVKEALWTRESLRYLRTLFPL